ncbi:unnamed protein product [Cuscuta epithymum]|uniref:Uncharacterized protein n=1 Tax=Cuscuta epithymum TaxID=186058 RepID=A0AAV0DWT5_9ASTE|nr:unnamed protein product [Cuscuta epithymum]
MVLIACDQSIGVSSPLTKIATLATATGFTLASNLETAPAKTRISVVLINNNRHQEPKNWNPLKFPLKSDCKKIHLSTKHQPFGAIRSIKQFDRPQSSSFICAAATGWTCSSAQTLPRAENHKTTNVAPQFDKGVPSTPRLDDSGPSIPPRHGGGGGGGGGGGNTSGGFFLFGFLLLLSHLKDEEEKLIERKKGREEVQRERLLGAGQ